MGKSAILKKIHNAAKNYQRYLAGKTFMYVYEGKSIEVVFKNSSFLHLTGVNTKLKAKEFYKMLQYCQWVLCGVPSEWQTDL